MKQSLTPALKEALKHLGHKEIGSSNSSPLIDSWVCTLAGTKEVPSWLKNQPWCGSFIAYCLYKAGMTKALADQAAGAKQYPRHWYRASDYRSPVKKLKKPAYGCIGVKHRNGGNHVFFVVGITPNGRIVALGGNQGNSVSYTTYSYSESEYYWYGDTNRPLNSRYELPVINNVSSTKVSES